MLGAVFNVSIEFTSGGDLLAQPREQFFKEKFLPLILILNYSLPLPSHPTPGMRLTGTCASAASGSVSPPLERALSGQYNFWDIEHIEHKKKKKNI